MRPWTVAIAAALCVALLLPTGSAEQCDEGDADCARGNAGQGNGPAPNATDNETRSPGATSPSSEDRRKAEREERKAEGWEVARKADRGPRSDEAQERRAQVPAETRELLGNLVQNEDGFDGTYVGFDTDPGLGILQQVTRDGTPLFDSVYLPMGLGETARMETFGSLFRVSGDDWTFWLQDHATTSMLFRTATDEPFLLVLPDGVTVEEMSNGVRIVYPGEEDVLAATLRGDVQTDPAEPGVLHVDGTAFFHVAAPRPLLPAVSNRVLPDLEAAIQAGQVGGEVTVLRAAESTYEDTVLYEDLDLDLEDQTAEAGVPTYTITVDSASHTGKTIAVAFESGLIDPENLRFEYFNVEANETTEAPIRQATDLQDVLDPLDDGTIAEYWIVQDADGVQVLMSIPHFSVHQIRLTSLVELIIEQPSLVIGTVGAALLVGAATVGMFRRPEDDA